MNILGISRSPVFSPNSADRDAALFAAVCSRLARRHDISTISEDLFVAVDLTEFDAVFTMARGTNVVKALAEAEAGGLQVINSAKSLLTATRSNLVALMSRLNVVQPETWVFSLNEEGAKQELPENNAQSAGAAADAVNAPEAVNADTTAHTPSHAESEADKAEIAAAIADFYAAADETAACGGTASPLTLSPITYPLWVKRGDACAQSAADTRFVTSACKLSEAFADFRARGIANAVLSRHLQGDLVKFYGVEGTDFFYHSYATKDGRVGKFGLEVHNGEPHGYNFDVALLKAEADRVARASGLSIYGGDAVIDADGTARIIDFNDCPSFGSCRKEAARAIATLFR